MLVHEKSSARIDWEPASRLISDVEFGTRLYPHHSHALLLLSVKFGDVLVEVKAWAGID